MALLPSYRTPFQVPPLKGRDHEETLLIVFKFDGRHWNCLSEFWWTGLELSLWPCDEMRWDHLSLAGVDGLNIVVVHSD